MNESIARLDTDPADLELRSQIAKDADVKVGRGPDKKPRKKPDGPVGFARMSPEKLREISAKGGRIAHETGKAHEWNSETARQAVDIGWANWEAKRKGTFTRS